MKRRTTLDRRQLAREKQVFRYLSALERGDFETIAAILREAEYDPALEEMIAEVNVEAAQEAALSPVLHPASTNHHREDKRMSVLSVPHLYPGQPTAPARRWSSQLVALVALAAMLAVFIPLVALRLGPPPSGNPPAALQGGATATPLPTLVPTSTPLPSFMPGIDPAFPQVSAASCTVLVQPSDVLTSEPFGAGRRILLNELVPPGGVMAVVMEMRSQADSPEYAYRVNAQIDGIGLQGWLTTSQVIETSGCVMTGQGGMLEVVPVIPTIVTGEIPAAALPPTICQVVNAGAEPLQIVPAPGVETSTGVLQPGMPANVIAIQPSRSGEWYLITVQPPNAASGGIVVTGWVPMGAVTMLTDCAAVSIEATLLPPTVVPPADVLPAAAPLARECAAARTSAETPLVAQPAVSSPVVAVLPANTTVYLVAAEVRIMPPEGQPAIWYQVQALVGEGLVNGWTQAALSFEQCMTAVEAGAAAPPVILTATPIGG